MKTCYYELLDVDSNASDSDLRKAYRKKALQYHPDKNRDNVEEATAIFATVRSAYEVLSDPQERAWYDSHKSQILSDDLDLNADDADDYEYEVDATITGITTEELLKFFNSALYTRVDDTPAGLYQIAGKVFAKLASDEVKAGRRSGLSNFDKYQDDFFESEISTLGYRKAFDKYSKMAESTLYPQFGDSATDFNRLRTFYQKWGGFGTVKTFSWKDEYMYSKNYDRRTKRDINKRNEKSRQQAKSEYNKTVKRFVTFIKKFDKRMKEGVKKFELEKRRKLQEDLRKQIEKDRQANLRNAGDPFKLQSWQTVDQEDWAEIEKHFDEYDNKSTNDKKDDSEEEEIIVYECFICNKNFKSENQLENHINTKMHKKMLRKVKWEMKKDSMVLGLDDLSDADEFDSAVEYENNDAEISTDKEEEPNLESMSELDRINEELSKIERELNNITSDEDSGQEEEDSQQDSANAYIEVDDIVDSGGESTDSSVYRKSEISPELATPATPSGDDTDADSEDELSKLLASLKQRNGDSDGEDWGNSKPKKTSKAKSQKTPKADSNSPAQSFPSNTDHSCGTCSEKYHSRNALFKHIKSTGHAAARSNLKKTKGRKRKA